MIFFEVMMMYAIGIMSGTSMDGIDTVLVDIDGLGMETKMKVIGYHEYPMPIDMKEKIKKHVMKRILVLMRYVV